MLFSHLQSEREKSAKEMVAVTDASSVSSSPGNQTPTGSKRKSTGRIKEFNL